MKTHNVKFQGKLKVSYKFSPYTPHLNFDPYFFFLVTYTSSIKLNKSFKSYKNSWILVLQKLPSGG